MRMNIKEATLEELENECAELMGTQFGHNMIGIICGVVEEEYEFWGFSSKNPLSPTEK